MSKYDFEVYTSDTTSTGIVLGKIKKGSTVLEFGCAAGRMTKYMKEELECDVYIVEYEQDAFDIARNYAAGGICDDIMNFAWAEKFAGIRFDAILFVDVLEHLSRPKDAVINAEKLLKSDGKIFISVPNVTHNDVVIKALSDRFDYTKVGLLDDTHVHFWGRKNIKEFASDCGMYLESLDATYCETGMTEQFEGKMSHVDPALISMLKARECGEVYQFVFVFSKTDNGFTDNIEKTTISGKLYTDTGEGFSEENFKWVESKFENPYEFEVNYSFEPSGKIRAFRYDPIEGGKCILKDLSVMQDGDDLDMDCPDGIRIKENIFINSNDPQISAQINPDMGKVTIKAIVMLPGSAYSDILEQALCENVDKVNTLQRNKDLMALVKKKEERILELENKSVYKKYKRKLRSVVKKVLKK